MALDAARAKSLFLAASDMSNAAERAAYLDSECGMDAELRARVEALLQADEAPRMPPPDATGAFAPGDHGTADLPGRDFATPAFGPGAHRPASEPTGDHVRHGRTDSFGNASTGRMGASAALGTVIAGRYSLIELIGEGGMGSVYRASQTEPVKRQVALKLIKAGMDSIAVLARFDAERQALALMDYPNIARIYDGGVTRSGQPFFVMELVQGAPLTEYCDTHRLSIEARLQLFVSVCQAVQHAHQKGIIHRDLKPGNVLVTEVDGRPTPKVIDFGVAKATEQRLTDQSLADTGAVVGTPAYMSPEQADPTSMDIDTRTDVYALGVILYELLTGSPPIDGKQFKRGGLLEMLRMVREVEPPRPSTKLGAADALPNIAANRSTEPAKLANALRKELDWVVMKALEKDRNRRYDSANGFATDVQRYLAGEAVQAVPPSAAYRLRKFIRRNRGLVLATALVFLSLIGGVIGTALGLAQARRQEKATRDEADQKEIARQGEAEARVRAEHATAGVRLDLDLAGYRDDPKTSLLRLARTLRGLPDHCREYREFATVAILSGGQEFAPLIPPITHDGRAVDFQLSPDGRTLFTLGPDRTGRLWDALTGHLIGSLRDRNELIAQYGFSPDGRWFFADDQTGAIRVWSTRHGSLRCEIPPRQKPYPLELLWTTPPNIQFSGDRLLILRVVGEPVEDQYRAILRGPVELWDAVSGRRIAELAPADRGGADFFGPGNVRFSPGGEWVFVRHDKTTLDVFSAADGRRLGTLAHPGSDAIEVFAVNPLGTRLLTQYRAEADRTWHLRGWQTARWTADPISPAAGNGFAELIRNVDYLSDDAFVVEGPRTGEVSVMKHGRPAPVAQFTARLHSPVRVADGLAWLGGDVIDIRSGERVVATGDRRFHPELVRFTSDGRFINGWGPDGMYGLIDTRADKAVLPGQVPFGYVHVPEAGFVAVHKRDGAWVHRIALLDVSPEYLELWLQVAVRGELGPGRQFVGWDEVTWERKRRELAARSVPVSGFPFPGRVATDRLHWLRGKYDAPDLKPAERLPLLDELVRRAEEDGDSNAATMWRAERSKYRREAAAPPREKR